MIASSVQDQVTAEYLQVLERLRSQHARHDQLEQAAREASRRSRDSYYTLCKLRERSRALREAYAALSGGVELDAEIAAAEDRLPPRVIESIEKKERELADGRRTQRPVWIRPGSTERAREAQEE